MVLPELLFIPCKDKDLPQRDTENVCVYVCSMQEKHKVFILCEVLCAHDSCMGFSLIGWKMLNVFLLMHTSLNDSSKAIF